MVSRSSLFKVPLDNFPLDIPSDNRENDTEHDPFAIEETTEDIIEVTPEI